MSLQGCHRGAANPIEVGDPGQGQSKKAGCQGRGSCKGEECRPLRPGGSAEGVRGGTSVVSTATCAPFQSGKPLAMTSIRRSSRRAGTTLRSLIDHRQARAATLLPRPLDRHGLLHARAQHRGSGGCRTEGMLRRDPQGHRNARHLQAKRHAKPAEAKYARVMTQAGCRETGPETTVNFGQNGK